MMQETKRTPAQVKAKELAKTLRKEEPDYEYLRNLFRYLRQELGVKAQAKAKTLPRVPSEDDVRRLYETVWRTRNTQDLAIVKTFLYTGVRVSELVVIRIQDVDLDRCQIRINQGKGGQDRVVPFPASFSEVLAFQIDAIKAKGGRYLFESPRRKPYSARGIRKMMKRYADKACLESSITPHQFRHFLLTWLKKKGIDDALIQPYSGHATRRSLEVYSQLALSDAQQVYDDVMHEYPL